MTKDSYGYPTKIPTKITDLYGGDSIPTIEDIPSSDDIVEEIEEYLDVDLATEGQVLTMGADGIVEWDDVASGGVSYSTDEKVVGTWIDGRNVYQKSFLFETEIAGDSNAICDLGGYYDILSVDMMGRTLATPRNKAQIFRVVTGEYDSDDKLKVRNPKSGTLASGTVITIKYIKET